MKGLIFSIKRYSVHDGPGIRVTFFMKGCPLNCYWCHNPEGISPFTETAVSDEKVGDTVFVSAKEVGRYYSVEEILEIIERERVFIDKSGGGVTFSGGEPMMQSEFLRKVLAACKKSGYHTAVDTSGYTSADSFRSIVSYTDLFLFDLKQMTDTRHIESTGVSNFVILENYRLLLGTAKEVWVRIPIIPGFNDDKEHLETLKKFLLTTKTESLTSINLLPYHRIGYSKHKRFPVPVSMVPAEPPSKERMAELKSFLSDVGIKVKIGG